MSSFPGEKVITPRPVLVAKQHETRGIKYKVTIGCYVMHHNGSQRDEPAYCIVLYRTSLKTSDSIDRLH